MRNGLSARRRRMKQFHDERVGGEIVEPIELAPTVVVVFDVPSYLRLFVNSYASFIANKRLLSPGPFLQHNYYTFLSHLLSEWILLYSLRTIQVFMRYYASNDQQSTSLIHWHFQNDKSCMYIADVWFCHVKTIEVDYSDLYQIASWQYYRQNYRTGIEINLTRCPIWAFQCIRECDTNARLTCYNGKRKHGFSISQHSTTVFLIHFHLQSALTSTVFLWPYLNFWYVVQNFILYQIRWIWFADWPGNQSILDLPLISLLYVSYIFIFKVL